MIKNANSLPELYSQRKGKYVKQKNEEYFLAQLNETLAGKEQSLYKDYRINFPFIFIFGLPRSGTTLITQVIANCLDVGYINNFMARFYLVPVHGIRLSKIFFGKEKQSSFKSDYAKTSSLTDIHEFGYYWRYWLKKDSFSGVTNSAEIENDIDWKGLKRSLANIQMEFKKPMVFKNIFGSYHINKLNDVLKKVIFIYIRRDPLDSAISILDARKNYYKNPNTWWSYMPIEYNQIKDLDYWHQIAGQVFFLKRLFDSYANNPEIKNILTIDYKILCHEPLNALKKISDFSNLLYNKKIKIVKKPPERFPFRTYENRENDKKIFSSLLEKFRA